MEQEKENIGAPQAAAHGAEARTEGGAAAPADLGKFKSVDALLNAYNSLEAEFTRRSQRLRELEGRVSSNEAAGPAGDNAQPPAAAVHSGQVTGSEEGTDGVSDELRKRVIAEYLVSVRKGAPPVMAGDGTHVSAPERRPRDFREAAELARDLFSKGD